jgi:hypothetical protein
MAKWIPAKDIYIRLENYKHGEPYVYLIMPLDFSFADFIQTIKIATNYGDRFEWDFYFDYYNMNLLSKYKKEEFCDIKLRQYMEVSTNNKCNYGPLTFYLQKRGYFHKHTKVHPIIKEAVGIFPTEDEFIKKAFVKDINKKHPEEYLKNTNEKLKEIFKTKYKISDEIDGGGYGSNKLIKK